MQYFLTVEILRILNIIEEKKYMSINSGKLRIGTEAVRKEVGNMEVIQSEIINLAKDIITENENILALWKGNSADGFARISATLDKNFQKWIAEFTKELEFINEYALEIQTVEDKNDSNKVNLF